MATVEIVTGDILDQKVEVIVNAWNRNVIPWWLLLPQGVSGAIKRRGGYAPFRELARMGVLRPGQAVLTSAGKLPFRGIIHVAALNLVWRSSLEIVQTGTANALTLAEKHGIASLAIPLLGAGIGGVAAADAEARIVKVGGDSRFNGRIVVVRYA